MQSIPVDISKIMFLALGTPKPKIKNRQTGEQSMDRDGRPVTAVRCACVPTEESDADVAEIEEIRTVSEVPPLRRGAPVQLIGLVAKPWSFRDDNGKERFGVTFWAEQITPLNGRGAAVS